MLCYIRNTETDIGTAYALWDIMVLSGGAHEGMRARIANMAVDAMIAKAAIFLEQWRSSVVSW